MATFSKGLKAHTLGKKSSSSLGVHVEFETIHIRIYGCAGHELENNPLPNEQM